MRNRSEAKRAASSPPVPARISRKAFRSKWGSLGMRSRRISFSRARRRSSSLGISAEARLLRPGSPSDKRARASSLSFWHWKYSSALRAKISRSERSLVSFCSSAEPERVSGRMSLSESSWKRLWAWSSLASIMFNLSVLEKKIVKKENALGESKGVWKKRRKLVGGFIGRRGGGGPFGFLRSRSHGLGFQTGLVFGLGGSGGGGFLLELLDPTCHIQKLNLPSEKRMAS